MPFDEQIILAFVEGEGQQGQRDFADDLRTKDSSDGMRRNQLFIVDGYDPQQTNTQMNRPMQLMGGTTAMGANSRLYIIGHCDGEARRMAGLTGLQMAQAVTATGCIDQVRRIVLIGCHSAGESDANDRDAVLLVDSFASEFHWALREVCNIATEVAAYTSYVQIHASGKKRQRFSPQAAAVNKLPKSKVLFQWNVVDDWPMQVRKFAYE